MVSRDTFLSSCVKHIALIAVLICFPFCLFSKTKQEAYIKLFDQSYYVTYKGVASLRSHWFEISKSPRVIGLQELSYGLDALSAMYEASKDPVYIRDAVQLTKNVIQRSRVSKDIPNSTSPFKDSYRGWVEPSSRSNNAYQNQEMVLSEIYFFRYVGKLLRIIKQDEKLLAQNSSFFFETLFFLEHDIWKKWRTRGQRLKQNYNQYLFLQRTHMASHWAFIAADLTYVTADSDRRDDYLAFVKLYNERLTNNILFTDKYVVWNSTWDFSKEKSRLQDVSHANLIIAYLVEVRELGIFDNKRLIANLINTVAGKIWDPKRLTFRDYLDGTYAPGRANTGSFQADGFVKLAKFDSSLLSIYDKFASDSPFATKWRQHGQLFANLALAYK